MATELTTQSNGVTFDADVLMGNLNNLEGRLVPSELFAQNTNACVGLTYALKSGRVRKADGTLATYAGGTVTLNPSTTNYLEVDPTGAVVLNTSRNTANKPIRKLVTDTGGIVGGLSSATNNVDERVGFDFTTQTVTVDQTVAPSSNTGLIATILNNLANVIKSMTGELDWKNTPATTLKAAKAKLDQLLFSNTTDTLTVPTGGGTAVLSSDSRLTIYPVAGRSPGAPSASAVLLDIVAISAFTLPINLSGSYGKADTAATGSTTFDIQKNGSSIGSMVFAGSGTTATFAFSASVSFAAGDRLKVIAPASPDATLAGITFTLKGAQ